ncbi:MAG TPA: YiiX family permuted papain-like enzyme [Ohtaekwangia sp.]|nr:YiiX family permuted papain-like enzyme [Ohtaekwangia sp.]
MKKIVIVILFGLIGAFGLFVVAIRIMADKPKKLAKTETVFDDEFRNGDIIFQTSRSTQSKAIQLATKSKYSHMGIIYETAGEYYVYEAVQPVKLTKLNDWIKRGESSHYVLKRLKNSERLLTNENLKKMKDFGERFKGKNYDRYFEWSDDKIYCSELVWKIYKETFGIEVGDLQELREFDLTNDIVRKQMKARYGNKIPLDEKVISPAAMFDSDKLITVQEN